MDMNEAMRGTMRQRRQRQYAGSPGMTPPARQPDTAPGFTIHPPGVPSNHAEYNYEPQPDGSWKTYPPGVQAPPTAYQASMPRAATNADMMRMRQEMSQVMGNTRGV